MFLIEEAWNAYPLCKTVLVNGYLDKNKFRVDIETMHVEDDCHQENALHLTPDELKHRKVEYLDIVDAYADHKHKDYKAEYAVTTYKSKATGRGPLAKGWEKSGAKPLMCAYKVCCCLRICCVFVYCCKFIARRTFPWDPGHDFSLAAGSMRL
jgi:hypothetical protein